MAASSLALTAAAFSFLYTETAVYPLSSSLVSFLECTIHPFSSASFDSKENANVTKSSEIDKDKVTTKKIKFLAVSFSWIFQDIYRLSTLNHPQIDDNFLFPIRLYFNEMHKTAR